MSFLLRTPAFTRSVAIAALRPAAPRVAQFHAVRALRKGDYGSGDGNPAAEKPLEQGKNPREDLEHPGPPPPKAAQGGKSDGKSKKSSSSSGKSESSSNSDSSSSSSSSESKKSGSGKPAVSTDKNVKHNSKDAQPKILNENPPAKGEESQEVREHNEEMEGRAEKAHESVSNKDAEKDKVGKGFWKGHAGADKEP